MQSSRYESLLQESHPWKWKLCRKYHNNFTHKMRVNIFCAGTFIPELWLSKVASAHSEVKQSRKNKFFRVLVVEFRLEARHNDSTLNCIASLKVVKPRRSVLQPVSERFHNDVWFSIFDTWLKYELIRSAMVHTSLIGGGVIESARYCQKRYE